jgi:hypothetical protein
LTSTFRSASATRPFWDPCQRISPLALPCVRGPATCSALNTNRSSIVYRPISWMTELTAWLALSTNSTIGSRICPLAWQNCWMTEADSRSACVTIWYSFFTEDAFALLVMLLRALRANELELMRQIALEFSALGVNRDRAYHL